LLLYFAYLLDVQNAAAFLHPIFVTFSEKVSHKVVTNNWYLFLTEKRGTRKGAGFIC